MHVLLLPSWYATPENPIRGSFFREQAFALRKAGHQVGVLVPPSRLRTWHGLKEVQRGWRLSPLDITVTDDAGLPTYRIPWWGWKGLIDHAARGDLALKVFDRYCREQGRPDVLHGYSLFYGGYLAAWFQQTHGIPAVLTEHSSAFIRRLLFPDQMRLARTTLPTMAALLAVSQPLADALRAYAPGRDIRVLGNGVDTDFFTPGATLPPVSPFTLTLIASLSPNKGGDVLLRAFQQAFAGQSVMLNLAGGGAQQVELEHLARQLGLSRQVRFMGRLTRAEVRDLIRQSHVIVSASYVETFGVTLIEALACGKPVVATRSGGPEAFINQHNGLLVNPGDSKGMAAALKQIKETYQQYDSATIHAEMVAHYSDHAITRQLETIYASVKNGF